ncbi:MAG: hypothetical protein JNM80_06375 [Phycisphaerae bacterium]|nr:hypothetical protein [Phycisphaerae bacterium]
MPNIRWLRQGCLAASAISLAASATTAQTGRAYLVGYGAKFLRVWPNGVVETFTGLAGEIWGMTIVPPGVSTTLYAPGDVLAVEQGGQARVWRVRNPRAGTPTLEVLGQTPPGVGRGDLAFAHGLLYVVNDGMITQLDVSTFAVVGTPINVGSSVGGGLAFDAGSAWYACGTNQDTLFGFADPPTTGGAMNLAPGGLGLAYRNSDLEWSAGGLRAALQQADGAGGFNMLLGTFVLSPTVSFVVERTIFAGANSNPVGLVVFENQCYANCDASTAPPVANVADFICFQNQFAAGSAYANCDNSTKPPVLNVADFICFLNAFAAGCP